MPPLIHALTHPGDLTAAAVVCGARDARQATWDQILITCPACQAGRTQAPARGHKRPVRPGMTETQFQAQVEALLRSQQWTYYHTRRSEGSVAGFPDLVAVREGPGGVRCVIAELKIPPHEPSAAQAHWLALLGQVCGVAVFVWTPADWPQIEGVLR